MGLFGGAVTINSPDFSSVTSIDPSSMKPFVILSGNTFTKNMAYLSGSAVYIRMTRRSDQKNYYCGSVLIQDDTYSQNFGTKVSSGTVSIVCDTVSDTKLKDYTKTSGYVDSGQDS
jgi:hypothetical protein